MKIYTEIEWAWDPAKGIYRPVRSESFEYSGPLTLLKSDALGVTDIVQTAMNHVENVVSGYQKDPERAFLGANTTYEDKLWGTILGKKYDDALVGDLATEGSPNTATDRRTAREKGIDTGSTEFVDGVARAVAMYYGGEAIGGAVSGMGGETVSGSSGVETLGGSGDALQGADLSLGGDIPAATTPAEGAAGVDTQAGQYLNNESATGGQVQGQTSVPDTGSGAPAGDTTLAEQNFAQGSQGGSNGGIIDSVLKGVKDNPLAAVGIAQLGGGIIGGAGKYIGDSEMQKQKAASDRELLAKKYEEEKLLADWRRRFLQSGALYTTALPIHTKSKVLTRPDGTPVYDQQGGLIASNMNPQQH